ncbi:hypothetical protein B7990_13935 [Fibrobacter sp. UWB4]|uniref:hypothetical protein n=1 Tax=Fibrobacter sp. UWB4 TaxID=1964356 RepID=UPI000B529163|nr:hypothetical protein [Fibrobacter sp. UWB4]OWV15539.1 hypothetical protein B7990_13935 [Fibrobacter sp. UWB4]
MSSKEEKIIAAINTTGFVFENKVVELLRKNNWTVIGNKYYEDDLTQTVREMDILAYKNSHIDENNVSVVTTLLISCKKNDKNSWIFFTRPSNPEDPNKDWKPLRFWTNEKRLKYSIENLKFGKNYLDGMVDECSPIFSIPEKECFAFQEVELGIDCAKCITNNKKGASKNDSNIFNSITSLLKSQAYEMSSLDKRMKKSRIYQFNLLSLSDVPGMYEVDFSDGQNLNVREIDNVNYLSSYIIKRQESFNRIRFLSYESFERAISQYDELHKYNCETLDDVLEEFYANLDTGKLRCLQQDFKDEILRNLFFYMYNQKYIDIRKIFNEASLYFDEGQVEICVDVDGELLIDLQENQKLTRIIADTLKKVYRYEGGFSIVDLPF